MNKFTVSRRGLLSAGVAASAASLASSVFAQEKKTSLVPDKWDLTTEVLVVGSGGGRSCSRSFCRASRSKSDCH